jgi:hypothetical protein
MLPIEHKKEFDLIDIDEDHAKATAFNMLFVIWRRETRAAAYRRSVEIARRLSDSFPEGIGVLQTVEPDTSPPDAEARKAFIELFHVDGIRHFSVTHEGTGFKAASVRAIMSSVVSLARPRFEHVVLKSVTEAAQWHALEQRKLGRHEMGPMIERIVRSVQRLHDDQFPT